MLGAQLPRVFSYPDYQSTSGYEAIELAATAGLHLDEWQQFVLVHSLGERVDGQWAAFEVGVDVARQNGKGGILEARELAGLFLLDERLLIHSAHQFDTSLEAFHRMEAILEGCPDLSRRVLRVSRTHGSEGFTLKSGQRLRYRTRTKGGGRGFTGDFLGLDEAMILPRAFMGALLPTLSARSIVANPQVWYTGSAVDQTTMDDGEVFTRVRDRGHKGDDSLAWFEWSVDAPNPSDISDEMLADPELWAQANPGLGIRISEAHIRKELAALDARSFAVERLGVGDWPPIDGTASVIPLEVWNELADRDSTLADPVGLAFDVSPDRAWSTISAGGKRIDGLAHVETVDRRRGTDWVVGRLAELAAAHKVCVIVCDAAGPAASLLPDLEAARIPVRVTPVTAGEHAKACGRIYDKADQRQLRHRDQPELKAAIRGATSRPLGDAWAWARKSSAVDISPLVAATLALCGFEAAPKSEPWIGW